MIYKGDQGATKASYNYNSICLCLHSLSGIEERLLLQFSLILEFKNQINRKILTDLEK